MSPWFGFDESEGVYSTFVPDLDLDLPIHDDLESQFCAGCQVGHDLPQEVEDPCYFGTEINTYHRCFHGHMPYRKVAFDMAATGRRFIGCPLKGKQRCRFIIWIDNPWNPVLTRALIKVWSMVGQETSNTPGVYAFHGNTDLPLHDPSAVKIAPDRAVKRFGMETNNKVGALQCMSSRWWGVLKETLLVPLVLIMLLRIKSP